MDTRDHNEYDKILRQMRQPGALNLGAKKWSVETIRNHPGTDGPNRSQEWIGMGYSLI
jgi:hypothetical protein